MKWLYPALILIVLGLTLSISGCTGQKADPAIPEMKNLASGLTVSINEGLFDIRSDLKNGSVSLSETGLSGPDAGSVLTNTLTRHPWAMSAVTVSREGQIMAAVPKQYAHLTGTDVSTQPQVIRVNAAKSPGLSGVIPLVEGYPGVFQSSPVFSHEGEYLGYIDITYAPEIFLGRYIEKATMNTPYDVWVVQTDGTEIYDTNREEIGKNIISDPIYADPALYAVASGILKEPSGTTTYVFWDRDWSKNVTKTAVWETAGIDGTEWRIVVTRAEGSPTGVATGALVTRQPPSPTETVNLTRFVRTAADYAQQHGKEAALAEFNNVSGRFIDKDRYIFAYEMNGTVIALPYQQGLLGTNRSGMADSHGVMFIDRLAGVSREGGGFVYYLYPNPVNSYREEFKISYALPVDRDWFIGSGEYLPGLPARFNTSDRDDLVRRVRQARTYAEERGAAQAIADFNNLNGSFANGSRYIFAYDFNGTTLALPYEPAVIGQNRMNYTDFWGVKVTDWEIAIAKQGGGFVYTDYYNPDTGTNAMKLCYVVPVDDHWLIGSGIYTREN